MPSGDNISGVDLWDGRASNLPVLGRRRWGILTDGFYQFLSRRESPLLMFCFWLTGSLGIRKAIVKPSRSTLKVVLSSC